MKLHDLIQEALDVSGTICYPIEDFTIGSLTELADLAKKNKVELRIRKEDSNFHQGTLLEVQRFHNRVDCKRIDER